MQRVDVVVVGLGAMGSAAAWHLARRGRQVLALEQFPRGHELGSSHGAARIFRLAYEHDDYVVLALEALGLWRELEAQAQRPILVQSGALDYGTPAAIGRIGAALDRHGCAAEELTPAAARRRWPGFAFDGTVLYSPDGGRTDADAARESLQDGAVAAGAQLVFGRRVTSIARDGTGVVVATEAGDVSAAVAIVTVNAWADTLLGDVAGLPRLRVTQEQPAFFAPRDAALEWPSFIRYAGDGTSAADFSCYGLASPSEGGVKVGEHGLGVPVDPDGERPPVDTFRLERLSEYVAHHLPGLDPEPIGATRCLYAMTPTEDFVVDRVGDVVVGVGFSGHGFKFVPVIGRILADLADGTGRPPPARFRLRARS